MDTHSHGFTAATWPFDDPDDAAAFCCRHVTEDDRPILRVTHDQDDGAWQFLCGDFHEADDARVVCLGCMVTRDKTLFGLADLPFGWCADRDAVDGPWRRAPNTPPPDS
jgi:hypothetical protein